MPETDDNHQPSLAAVDLGSNSFHMVIGRVIGQQVSLLDRLREPVRLAAGLMPDGRLDPDRVEVALGCLERFAQRLRSVDPDRVRVVGTNTLRRAKRARRFVNRARETLGAPIEVLPGAEEARLIYLGVSHDVEAGEGSRLVIDIGGGSTECILGEGFEPRRMNSLHMGCVSWTQRFFAEAITREGFRAAELAARQEMEPIARTYRKEGWREAIGSSGTIRAVREILSLNGWSDGFISRDALKRLRKELVAAGNPAKLALNGLQEDRAPVFAGGVAILKGVCDSLKLEGLRTSDYALREGILYDLFGRIDERDVRERTVENLARRYHVDIDQAARVELAALDLFKQVAGVWNLEPERWTRFLRWASRLVEVGLAVSYSGYHKHSAYLVGHSTLPGFSREGRSLLAALVRYHRRRLEPEAFEALPYDADAALRLVVILRIAVALNRGRRATDLPPFQAKAGDSSLKLRFPEGWLAGRPLTSADLASESAALLAAGIRFSAA